MTNSGGEGETDRRRQEKTRPLSLHLVDISPCRLDFPAGSFDLVFSNWLFMYLGDKETQDVFERCMKWLVPGGHFFVRESCYHQSGNRIRNHYTLYLLIGILMI